MEGLEERPLPGDLCSALYDKPPTPFPSVIIDEGDVLACRKCFIVMGDVSAICFTQGGRGLNTFSRKGCPGREVYWLNTRGLSQDFISMETSRFLCYMTGYHGPHNGVLWLCVSRTDRPSLGAGSNACHSQLHKFLVCLNLLQPYQEFCLVPRCTHLTLKLLHFPFSSTCPPHSFLCSGSLCRMPHGWWASR